MKLIFLIILLCGITPTPTKTASKVHAKKVCTCHPKATTAKAVTSNMDIVPAGILFQF
ncbi:MAG TPA: hypothetical protein VNT20_02670 [Flavisolibacter sp.]|nr:hypothetical protein [Flavisolibacter sp.]